MAMLKKKQREEINELLQKGNLFEQLNDLLKMNGLEGLEVGGLKLVPRSSEKRGGPVAFANLCPNGQPPRPVITSSGTVRWVCTDD